MKDPISIERLSKLHPKVKSTFKAFIEEAENVLGITLRIVQGLRTVEEQNELYAQGRTKAGKIVTNAKGGSSYHNYGLAIDLVEIKDGQANWNFDYSKIAPIGNRYGLFWGGNFKSILDKPHFEKSFGFSVKQLLEKYNKKDFIKGTSYVNI